MARRYMKNEAQGNSLQATVLVHEVYLRLIDVTNVEWQARAQFFAIAAQMMRRILVDAARSRGSRRRGGIPLKVNLDESVMLSPAPDRAILALDEALTAFSQVAPRQAKVVELRYFGGLTDEEIVAALEDLAAHCQTRLAFRQGLAAARVTPYNRETPGTPGMTPERVRQIEELYHAARECTRRGACGAAGAGGSGIAPRSGIASDRGGGRRISRSACNSQCAPLDGGCRRSPVRIRARAWDPTVSRASWGRAVWARSFGPSTRG